MEIRYSRGLDEVYLNRWITDPSIACTVPCEDDLERRNFVKSWMYYTSLKAGLSLVLQDTNVAMGVLILMPYKKVQHHALLQIMVDPKMHNKGIGTHLLKNMLHLAKNYLNLDCVFMEYIGPKDKISFFTKRGFRIYAEQKGYVEGPYPDKILLECLL